MLKQNWRIVSMFERFGDNLIIIVSFVAAYYGRASLLFWNEALDLALPFAGEQLLPIQDYLVVLFVGLIGYSLILNLMGAYGSMRLSSIGGLVRITYSSSAIVFLLISSVLFLVKFPISRSFIGLFVLLSACGLTLERYFVLKVLRFWRRRGRNYRNVIICGLGSQSARLASELRCRPELGIHVRAFADLSSLNKSTEICAERFRSLMSEDVPVGRILTGVEAVSKALQDYAIDEVIFTDIVGLLPEVRDVISICGEQGIRTTIVADIFSLGLKKSEISYFGGMPLIHFQAPPGALWALSCKRMVDILASTFLLIALTPIFLVLAIGVRSTPGPILFKQKRMGLNGRIFELIKFRSMVQGADGDLHTLMEMNEMAGPVFKMARDPRITRFGRFMRRFSLDELPQLWNVLVGDMSLVGPRPPLPGEVSLYDRKSRRRLSMRPGLTCIWQVSGRSEIVEFKDWVALDLHYIDNWSLALDVKLLVQTVPAVLLGRGAH